MLRCSRVWMMRLPMTSSMSSKSSSCCCAVQRRSHFFGRQKRLGGLIVSSQRGNRNQLLLGITKGGEFSAEHAAGIDVDRAIQPFRLGDRRMAIHHHRLAAIFGRPVVTDGQAVFVGLSGGLSVERKFAHLCQNRAPAFLLSCRRVRLRVSVIEHVVADQIVDKLCSDFA